MKYHHYCTYMQPAQDRLMIHVDHVVNIIYDVMNLRLTVFVTRFVCTVLLSLAVGPC